MDVRPDRTLNDLIHRVRGVGQINKNKIYYIAPIHFSHLFLPFRVELEIKAIKTLSSGG